MKILIFCEPLIILIKFNAGIRITGGIYEVLRALDAKLPDVADLWSDTQPSAARL